MNYKMIQMKNLIQKNKEVIMYLIFGVLTTVVNIIVYYIFNDVLHVHYMISNVIAWIISVLFAYITNRKYVFVSSDDSIIHELTKFVGARVSTGIMDMVVMWLLVDVIHINSMIAKIISNVLVIISNYVLSKLFVFKENGNGKD